VLEGPQVVSEVTSVSICSSAKSYSFDVRGAAVDLFLCIGLDNRVVAVDVVGGCRFLMLGEIFVSLATGFSAAAN
jgi:hypothetical protein